MIKLPKIEKKDQSEFSGIKTIAKIVTGLSLVVGTAVSVQAATLPDTFESSSDIASSSLLLTASIVSPSVPYHSSHMSHSSHSSHHSHYSSRY